MRKITKNYKAYAKVNLFLDVTEKLSNGYHNIKSIMQEVSLCDDISISVTLSEIPTECEISVICNNTDNIPCNENNIAWKAADMLLKAFGTGKYFTSSIHIEITKNIPSPGGLGGGSADCAAVLNALNDMFELNLDISTLMDLGVKIGADVPFCIQGGTAAVEGIGEIVRPISLNYPKNCCFVIANAGIGMPTPLAFGLLDDKFDNFSLDKYINGTNPLFAFENVVDAVKKGCYNDICKCTYNIFEDIIKSVRPEIQKIFDILSSNGADTCFLSGSGPSVVGMFTDKIKLLNTMDALSSAGIRCWSCRPVTKYPSII